MRSATLRRIVSGAVIAVLVSTCIGVASAQDHRAPRVTLRTGGHHERGIVWSQSWTHRDGRFCAGVIADGVPIYPHRAVPWDQSDKIHILFWKDQRPRHVAIRYYRRLDENRYGAGRSRRLDFKLHSARPKGRRIWIAVFRGPRVKRLFLDVNAQWRDEEGCDGPESMNVLWHLRDRSY
jgi:hypothetical protein